MRLCHRYSTSVNTMGRIYLAPILVICSLPLMSPAAYAGDRGDSPVLNDAPDGDTPAALLAKKRVFLPLGWLAPSHRAPLVEANQPQVA